jgi:hypothetical protein
MVIEMDIIKQEKINKDFGIVLQHFDSGGYEVCINAKNKSDEWHETDGIYPNKKSALKVYSIMKKEYKNKRIE